MQILWWTIQDSNLEKGFFNSSQIVPNNRSRNGFRDLSFIRQYQLITAKSARIGATIGVTAAQTKPVIGSLSPQRLPIFCCANYTRESSSRKSRMPMFRIPLSSYQRLRISWRTMIFGKASPVRDSGLFSVADFLYHGLFMGFDESDLLQSVSSAAQLQTLRASSASRKSGVQLNPQSRTNCRVIVVIDSMAERIDRTVCVDTSSVIVRIVTGRTQPPFTSSGT